MSLKLGKLAPKFNKRTLSLSKYLLATAPDAPPTKVYWEYLVKNYPMMKNDELGCCVFAAGGHMLQMWTAHIGPMITPTDDEIVAAYSAVGGYVPGNPATDNGAAITDFLSYWQKTPLAGKTIAGWAAIDQTNLDHIHQGVYLFGAVDIGIAVPQSAMDQFNAGQNWDVVANDGGILGGHSIPVMGYGSDGLAVITWGKIQYMSNEFFAKYCDESYAILTPDFVGAGGPGRNSLDLAALNADLKLIAAS